MTEKEMLFRAVFWQSTLIIGLLSVVIGGGLTIVGFFAKKKAGCILAVLTVLMVVVVGPLTGYLGGNTAIGPDWEQAIDDKATYFEKLHGVWSRYDIERHECQYRDNDFDINDTGCEYVTREEYCAKWEDVEICIKEDAYDKCIEYKTERKCADTDYEFFPWFCYEESLTAELNIFKGGHIVFTSHLAPEDWRAAKWHLPLLAQAGTSFEYERPYEWIRIQQAIDAGKMLPGSVWNTYSHWIYADDYTILEEYSPHISKYREAGLLPTINYIHDSMGMATSIDIRGNVSGIGYDYDIVQLLNLSVDQETYDSWQQTAHLWGAMAGPEIQSSLILLFAPTEQVTNPWEWMQASKAWLMTEKDDNGQGHERYILPKNGILVGCGVSADLTTIEWCRAETGLFRGNEQFITDMEKLSPFPFTPWAAFGTMTGDFKVKNGEYAWEDPDWDDRNVEIMIPRMQFSGGAIDTVIRNTEPGHGFHRVEMESFKEKRIVIQPDPEQINGIKSAKRVNAALATIMFWGIVIVLGAVAARQSNR